MGIPTPPAWGPPPPPGQRPKARPITDPEEYRNWIRRWIAVVEAFDYPDIHHKSPVHRAKAVENRRKVLVAAGEMCSELGWIRTALPVRKVAERAGVTIRTAHHHLTTEADIRRLLSIVRGGAPGVGSKWATVYKLNLNRLRELLDEQAERAARAG